MHDLIRPIATTKKRARTKLPPLAPNRPKFVWTAEHQESFDKLKEALTSTPILAYPNYSKKFILETDTSLKGWVLSLLRRMMMETSMSSHMQVVHLNRTSTP